MTADIGRDAVDEGGVRLERPGLPPDAPTEQIAYQIVCLAEHNVAMQRLGFPPEQANAAQALARQLALGG
ncbi:hypothetical protein [Streptomyces sp. NPDC058739]|uniref:hypothetical protein n=1 Tax=Streptomyces sp. NPDC058739 TaxID=3346618 RepID=UPI00368AA201